MLFLHPTSTCDVCLEKYSWDEPDAPRPHAIRCGHVFCMQCLERLRPKVCPLCRSIFNHSYKLHIDVAEDDSHLLLSTEDLEARRLAEKVADVSIENVEDDARKEVLDEVLAWLENLPDDTQKVLRQFVSLLHRWSILHANLQENIGHSQRLRNERNELRERLVNSEREREEEREQWRRQSATVVSRMTELTQTYETKIIEAEMNAKRLETQFEKLTKTNDELTASLEALRNAPPPAPAPPPAASPLPVSAPSEPVALASHNYSAPITDTAYRYSPEPISASPPRTRNPLPPPPVPVPISLLPEFARPEKYKRRTRDRERERDRDHDRDRNRVGDSERERVRTRDGGRPRTGDMNEEYERERSRMYSRHGKSAREDRTTSARTSWYDGAPVHESELSQDDREREAHRRRQRKQEQERRVTEGNHSIYPASHSQSTAYAPPPSRTISYSQSQSHIEDSTLPRMQSFDNSSESLVAPRPKLPVPIDVYEGIALAANGRDSGAESGRETDRERDPRSVASSFLADTSYGQISATDRSSRRKTPSRRASQRGGETIDGLPQTGGKSSSRRMASMPEAYSSGRDQERRHEYEYQVSGQTQDSGSYYAYYPAGYTSTSRSYAPTATNNAASGMNATSNSGRRGTGTTRADGYDASYLSTTQSRTDAQSSQPRLDRTDNRDKDASRNTINLNATREYVRTLHPSGSFDSPRVRRVAVGADQSNNLVSSSDIPQTRPRQRAASQADPQAQMTKTQRRRSLLDQLVDGAGSSSLPTIYEPMPRRHGGATIADEQRTTEFGVDESFVTRTHSQSQQAQPRTSGRSGNSTMRPATATGTSSSRRDRLRGDENAPAVPPVPAIYRLHDASISSVMAPGPGYELSSQFTTSTRTKTRDGTRSKTGERTRDGKSNTRSREYAEQYPGGYVPTSGVPDAGVTDASATATRAPATSRNAAAPDRDRKHTPPQPPRSEHIVYMAQTHHMTPTTDAFPFTGANLVTNNSSGSGNGNGANRNSGLWQNYVNGPAEASSSTLVLPYVPTTETGGVKEGEKI